MWTKLWQPCLLLLLVKTAAAFSVNENSYAAFSFQGVSYGVFRANPRDVSLHWQDEHGQAYQGLYTLKRALEKENQHIFMLMNAGIYSKNHTPAGLWIEKKQLLSPLNRRHGKGNFHILPNGVFFIARQHAKILTTAAYQKGAYQPVFAVQSGPMLLIDGKINRRFVKNLSSPYKRNAVCTKKDGTLYFIMTESYQSGSEWPSFYRLAEALKSIGCYQALYLDGAISAWYIPRVSNIFHWKPFVGMIAVTQTEPFNDK